MVANRHPFVVGQQRLVRPEHRPDIGGMENRCVEIRIASDAGRQKHGGVRLRDEAVLNLGPQPNRAGVNAEQLAQPGPERCPHYQASGHEGVQVGLPAGCPGGGGEQIEVRRRGQVQNLIADRHADPRREVFPAAKDPVGQVLQGKIRGGGVGRLDPTAAGGVVGLIEYHREAGRRSAQV